MATKKLKWGDTKVSSFSDGRACLVVQFLDPAGNLLEWVPRWSQVQTLFERATNTEIVNKPDSEWLAAFAKTASDVFKGIDALKDAYKISGRLSRIRDGNLVFVISAEQGWNEWEEEIPPAFAISESFFENWLDEYMTVLVINGYAVKIWRTSSYGKLVYPEPVTSDLPFE